MLLTKEQEEVLQDIIPEIVPRAEWGAQKALRRIKLNLPVSKVVFVHSKSNPCYSKEECIYAVHRLQDYQMEDGDGKVDIEHNFLIGRDGTVLEGRGWQYASSQIDGEDPDELSFNSLEIAFLGYPMLPLTKYQKEAALGLLATGIQNKYLTEEVSTYQFEFEEHLFKEGHETSEDELLDADEKFWDAMSDDERKEFEDMDGDIGRMDVNKFSRYVTSDDDDSKG